MSYIVKLICEDNSENEKFGRHLEINDYDSAIKTYFTLVKGICEDYLRIMNSFEITFGHSNTVVYKFSADKKS